ncbi:TonB-dependent siderophore receptor [Sphingomonas sp. OK281]|uniref:TonB-dependent siderophore receptor n=1 Tax=Sphingomonas sp. OK281 TaxID=1881067 RepID=UPI0008E4DB17|nr:TonB-dependent siderophore receptor [Sphingomonas sp. OK281]SFO38994.1 outer-membrane receptor for ferric coprogen and ferric-rhodotorulic acid [Sphingomonas sp. OK281]
MRILGGRGSLFRELAFVARASLLIGGSVSVHAQVAQKPPENDETEAAANADIVVTGSYTTNDQLSSATGLGLTIQETPQSVTVMTAQRLEDQAIRTLSDVINNAAGVSAKAFDSTRNGFSARGFAIDNYQIDGVPLQWDAGYSAGESEIDVGLYERVEIVRGATGLLSGAGNPSASVNLVRKHADSRTFTATLTAAGSRWNNYFGMLDVTAPVAGNGDVRVRGVAKYEEGDSFIDFLHNKKLVLYGVLDADLTRNTALSIGASYQDNAPRGTLWGGLPVWNSDGTRTDWSRSKTIGADWTRWSSTNQTYFANLTQTIGSDWALKLYGSYSRNQSDMRLLYLYGQVDKATGLGMNPSPANYRGDLKQIDLGARLNGKFKLLGREHEVILGTSFARQTLDFYGFPPDYGNLDPIGNFYTWDGSYAEPAWGARSHDVDWRTKQWGYFGATRLSVSDRFKVILGGRLSSWERIGVSYGTNADFGDRNRFLPYAGALYDVVPGQTLYASYSKIFQPQSSQDRNGGFLAPVYGVNYEAGLKSRFFGGALNTALSVFRIEQDNLAQVDTGYLVPGTINQAYYAANGARSTGFEIEANGEILPGWAVSGNYTQFSAKDADDKRINTLFAQKLLRVFSTYRFAGALEGLAVGGGVNWEGLSYTDTTNPVTGEPERLEVRPYALVNLMARYQLANGLSLQANVENAFNKKYYSQIGFYDQLAFGEPRNVTLTLRYHY